MSHYHAKALEHSRCNSPLTAGDVGDVGGDWTIVQDDNAQCNDLLNR